jgi:hypothetical protein
MEVRAEKITEESGQTDGFGFVPLRACQYVQSGGTFADAVSSNVPSVQITSGGTNGVSWVIPVLASLARSASSRGLKLTSAEVLFKIATQACTAVSLKLWKIDHPADGTATSASEVASSKDVADASCYDADEHRVVLTPTTAAFIADDEDWHIELLLTPANGSVIDFYGCKLNFTRAL